MLPREVYIVFYWKCKPFCSVLRTFLPSVLLQAFCVMHTAMTFQHFVYLVLHAFLCAINDTPPHTTTNCAKCQYIFQCKYVEHEWAFYEFYLITSVLAHAISDLVHTCFRAIRYYFLVPNINFNMFGYFSVWTA